MKDMMEVNKPGLVGVLVGNTVIYNILENESEFLHSGLSIINFLKHDKNKFVANVIQSQSYNGIKYIFDNRLVLGEIYEVNNTNIEDYHTLASQVKHDFENIYIYDYENDMLLTYWNGGYIALDYKNESDIRHYINSINHRSNKWENLKIFY